MVRRLASSLEARALAVAVDALARASSTALNVSEVSSVLPLLPLLLQATPALVVVAVSIVAVVVAVSVALERF